MVTFIWFQKLRLMAFCTHAVTRCALKLYYNLTKNLLLIDGLHSSPWISSINEKIHKYKFNNYWTPNVR